jgi:hypothetical protein
MKTLPLSLVLAAALAAPGTAQRMGSSNSDAPTVTQTIQFAKQSSPVEIKYTAVTWADGKTMEAIANKENGARTRQRINNSAKNSPLGSFSTPVAITLGGKAVPAGEYKLYFNVDDDLKWHLILGAASEDGDETELKWKLDLKDTPKHVQRLQIVMTAGDKSDTANLEITFGKMSTTVAATVAAKG